MSDVIAAVFIAGGLFFFFAGTVALLRFPDIFTRLHALTKADTVGLGLVVLGLVVRADAWPVRIKLVLIWLLVLGATATTSHLVARTGLERGLARGHQRGAEPGPERGHGSGGSPGDRR